MLKKQHRAQSESWHITRNTVDRPRCLLQNCAYCFWLPLPQLWWAAEEVWIPLRHESLEEGPRLRVPIRTWHLCVRRSWATTFAVALFWVRNTSSPRQPACPKTGILFSSLEAFSLIPVVRRMEWTRSYFTRTSKTSWASNIYWTTTWRCWRSKGRSPLVPAPGSPFGELYPQQHYLRHFPYGRCLLQRRRCDSDMWRPARWIAFDSWFALRQIYSWCVCASEPVCRMDFPIRALGGHGRSCDPSKWKKIWWNRKMLFFCFIPNRWTHSTKAICQMLYFFRKKSSMTPQVIETIRLERLFVGRQVRSLHHGSICARKQSFDIRALSSSATDLFSRMWSCSPPAAIIR